MQSGCSSGRGRPPPGAAAATMQKPHSTADDEAARKRALAGLEGKESQFGQGIKVGC